MTCGFPLKTTEPVARIVKAMLGFESMSTLPSTQYVPEGMLLSFATHCTGLVEVRIHPFCSTPFAFTMEGGEIVINIPFAWRM